VGPRTLPRTVRALASLLSAAAVAPASPAAAAAPIPAPPAKEHIRTTAVPTPPGLTGVRFPSFTADGSRLIAAATSTAFRGTQLVTFGEDGGGLRCLTCGVWTGPALLKPYPFGDGRRVLVRIGAQSPVAAARHGVLECTPSVLRCDSARIVPIAAPAARDPNVEQDQRELRIAPDGEHVAFTQVRRTAHGRSDGVGAVGRLVRRPGGYAVAGARVVATGGELKGFTPDGQGILFARYSGAFEAANPDDVRIDLRTGRQRRVTTAPDWDEDVDLAPRTWAGRGWMVVGSARGSHLLEAASQVRRPAYIDAGIRALPFVVFAARGAAIAEPWLADDHDARGGYRGQPLAPGAVAAGWDSKPAFQWSPGGTAIVFWQQRVGGAGRTRAVVAHLADRRAQREPRRRATPVARWAEQLAGYVPPDPDGPRRSFSRAGRASGRVTVRRTRSARAGYAERIEVRYRRFADERGFVLDGVERADYTLPGVYGGASRYDADIRLSGRHTGYLKATGVRIGPGLRGTIRSRVGDRRLSLGPLGPLGRR
jgi:hypothetical protein